MISGFCDFAQKDGDGAHKDGDGAQKDGDGAHNDGDGAHNDLVSECGRGQVPLPPR